MCFVSEALAQGLSDYVGSPFLLMEGAEEQ
nr:MAG TPA: hypothetical protein [Caudoviricetes sp.]